MMKNRILALIMACTMVFMATACSGGAQPASQGSSENGGSEEIHVGIVVKSLADQYWTLVKAGAESKAAEMGVRVDVIAPNSESDIQAQVDMIDNMIGRQVDVLCVAPSSQDAVLTPFKTADDAGIPVLTIDTDTTFENRITFIGTGNTVAAYSGGVAAAEAAGPDAKAIIIRGRLGDTTHDQREAGYLQALEEAGIEVLEIKAADSDPEKAMNIMQDLLQVYDQIDLVLSTADNQTIGAQRAIEAAGADTLIMSFDGTVAACELILEGKMLGSVAQDPYAMGELAIENAVKILQGESVPEYIDSGSAVIMQHNAAAHLADLQEKSS